MKFRVKRKHDPMIVGKNFATIDPGLGGTGVALWRGNEWDHLCTPTLSYNIVPDIKAKTLGKRLVSIANKVEEKLIYLMSIEFVVELVFIELPEFMEYSAKGSAAARGGDLVKLSMCAGAIASVCPNPQFVNIGDWKGNAKKEIIFERIYERLEIDGSYSSHELDAIGIGLHLKGMI